MSEELQQRSKELRKNYTQAELALWQAIRKKQLYGYNFRRQFVIGNYIADFACLEKRLIVEVDGGQHMDDERYDLERDAWIRSQNFTVLRFWNNEVLNNLDSVLFVIADTLNNGVTPSP